MIRFILKCILIPAAAVFIILLLNRTYKKIDDQNYADVIKFNILRQHPQEIQIGNLGSSHGAYGFSYENIESRGYTCFNFGNVSQSFDYDYAMLREFGQNMADGSVLFIPVSYFSFNNEVINEAEAEAMSIRYYHCLSPQNIPDYDLYIDIVTTKVPILSAGEDILKMFPKIDTVLTAHAAGDEVNIEELMQRAKERYSRHFDNKDEYFMPERTEELYAILDYCHENRITPVLITTPFSCYYNDLVSPDFLEEFYATINTIAAATGTDYYDYSHDARFSGHPEYFMDPDHLNSDGVTFFMDTLWNEVTELERFH